MRYTFDCEFNEGMLQPLIVPSSKGERHVPSLSVWGVELISIGVVCQDGREFYACNKGYNPGNCNSFVAEHVEPKLPTKDKQWNFRFHPQAPQAEQVASTHAAWLSMREIAQALEKFIRPDLDKEVRLYAYYSAYDHVALCSLWGTMMGLPDGMPKYTRDLKVMAEQCGMPKAAYPAQLPPQLAHDALNDARWDMQLLQAIAGFQQGRL